MDSVIGFSAFVYFYLVFWLGDAFRHVNIKEQTCKNKISI